MKSFSEHFLTTLELKKAGDIWKEEDLNENQFPESEGTTRWSILGGIVGVPIYVSKFHSPYSFYSWPIWKT